jgi:hypothetical protein
MKAVLARPTSWLFCFLFFAFFLVSLPTAGRPVLYGQSETSNPSGGRPARPSEFVGNLVSAVVGALVGGLIGWRASLTAVRQTEELAHKREIEQAQTLRKMVESEIDYNLKALQEDAERLKEWPQDITGIQWTALHPCPRWSTVVWEHSVSMLALSLDRPEALAVYTFYSSLQSLTYARETLMKIELESRHPQLEHDVPYSRIERLTKEIQSVGNPLVCKKVAN